MDGWVRPPIDIPRSEDLSARENGGLYDGLTGRNREVIVGNPLLYLRSTSLWHMTEFLSENDLSRIAKFLATPEYEREPELLIPDDDDS